MRFLRGHLGEVRKDRLKPVTKLGGYVVWWGLTAEEIMFEGMEMSKRMWYSNNWKLSPHGFQSAWGQGGAVGRNTVLQIGTLPRVLWGLCKVTTHIFVCMLVLLAHLFLKAWDQLLQHGIWYLLSWLFFSSNVIKLIFWSLARLPHFVRLPTCFVNGGLLILYSK